MAAKLRAGRRGDPGQDQSQRVGQLPLDRSTSGWSSRGGQTRNPYALDRNPCGSSSGSAVAVAANLCAAAIGTETDGSIICPSHANAIVGIKPTVGLVSRAGIIPIAHSQDTAGPMARTCRRCGGRARRAGRRSDPRDPATESGGRSRIRRLYSVPRSRRTARGADRRGAQLLRLQPDGRCDHGGHASRGCEGLGAEIVDPADIATPVISMRPKLEVLLYEFKADLNAYLAGLGPDATSPLAGRDHRLQRAKS